MSQTTTGMIYLISV